MVLLLARVLGELFRRFNQPALAGEILAGLLLGQTVLGHLSPDLYHGLFPDDAVQLALFDVVAQIGILFLLLVIGLEVDVVSAWKLRNQSLGVAISGVIVPLALGFGFAYAFYDAWAEVPTPRIAFSLFVGTAVAITAITVVARLLFDLRILKSDLGLLLISALAINDLLGWVVLAIVIGMVGSLVSDAAPALDAPQIGMVVVATVVFAGAGATWGRDLVTRILQWFDQQELPSPATPLSFVVCLGLACGIVAQAIGVHPIFGFLIAGLMAGDPSALSEHTRSVITQMVESIFVPLFFAGICLHVDFATQFHPGLVFAITALSILGKFFGAWLGTWIVRLPAFDRIPVAIAHIPGGSMGVLLAVVAKESHLIGPAMFVAIVFASIFSSLLVGPALSWSLRRREALNVVGFFSRRAILPALHARERFEAIDELVRFAAGVESQLDAERVGHAVRTREETMGTGIGDGIAVPHARLPGLAAPLVVCGVSRDGIDWNAVDDEPAHLLFLILTPTDEEDTQLEILSTLARGLGEASVRDRIVACGTADGIWAALHPQLRKSSKLSGP